MRNATMIVALLACLAVTARGQSPQQRKSTYPSTFVVDNNLGFVAVNSGEGRSAFLLECHRRTAECQLIEAEYYELKNADPFLAIHQPFRYSILSWDADGIVAQDDAPICVTDRLVITFADKSAVLVKSPKKTSAAVRPLLSCQGVKSETVQLYPRATEHDNRPKRSPKVPR